LVICFKGNVFLTSTDKCKRDIMPIARQLQARRRRTRAAGLFLAL